MREPRGNRRLMRKLSHSGFVSHREKTTRDEGGCYKVDESTGQVYTETTAPIQSTDGREWTRQPCIPLVFRERDEDLYGASFAAEGENLGARRVRGTRPLQDSVVECILNNISDITLSGMECLPYHLVQRIWDSLCNSRPLLSFHIWVIFSKLLHQGEGATLDLLRYREQIENPTSPLQVYTTPLTSNSFDFITSLSITTPFPLPDLVHLSKITNLGVLEIINLVPKTFEPFAIKPVPIAVSDRLIRAWNFAAINDGAFKVLRILRLWYHEELSSKSLGYLNGFPALALYDVRGCSFEGYSKVDAKRFGWKATIDENVLHLLEDACAERAVLMQEALGAEARPVRRASARQLWDGSRTRKMPRSEVPSFLTRPEALVPGETHKKFACPQKISGFVPDSYTEGLVPRHRWEPMDASFLSNYASSRTWEFNTYTSFARIGELRNDTDLSRAGVALGDQFLVQNELVNSVPIASLRLGETPKESLDSASYRHHKSLFNSLDSKLYSGPFLKYELGSEKTRWGVRGMAFIRIKVPPVQTLSEGQSADTTRLELEDPDKAAITKSTKSQGISVKKSKKRSIGDLLGSFV